MQLGTAVSSRTRFYFGWWVVFASAAIVFLTGGTFFYGFGALFNPIIDEFGWSRAATSFAFSLRTEVGGLAALGVGFLVDRLGSRRLLVIGVTIVAIGFLLLSRVESLWTFYGAVIVIAIGMSAAGGSVGMVAIAHWFRRRRGRALAYMTMGAGSSGVMVLVLAWLIALFGWRDALVVVALVQLAICIPLALSIRDRPEDLGLTLDGAPGEADLPSARPEPVEGRAPARGFSDQQGLTAAQALRSFSFWRMALASSLANLGTIAIIVHQIPFFTSQVGLSEGLAAASVTAMTAMSLFGRFGFGYLADVIDKRVVMASAYAVGALSILLFATIYHGWQIFLVLPLFSLGFGGSIPVRPAFQAEYFGLRAFGAIQGVLFTISTLGGVLGPVFAGWVFDTTDSYRLAFVLLSAGGFLAAPLVLTVRRPRALVEAPETGARL